MSLQDLAIDSVIESDDASRLTIEVGFGPWSTFEDGSGPWRNAYCFSVPKDVAPFLIKALTDWLES